VSVRRRLTIIAITSALIGAAFLVALGPATLRPWRCHHVVERPSPRQAAQAYYASCWNGPKHLSDPLAAGTDNQGSGTKWFAMDEFAVEYGEGKTRFLFVGQRSPHSGWTVLPAENSGP
jgi:hypothetical protein